MITDPGQALGLLEKLVKGASMVVKPEGVFINDEEISTLVAKLIVGMAKAQGLFHVCRQEEYDGIWYNSFLRKSE